MTPPAHALTIALHPDGWKLHILNEGQPQEPIRLTIPATESIARVIGDAVIAEGLDPMPWELVRKATEGLKVRIEKELQEAEATARTIPGLRKAREEVDNIQ